MDTFERLGIDPNIPGSSLAHFGIPGMKHGRRRYQNEDGSWTTLGMKERRAREGFGERRRARKEAKAQRKAEQSAERSRQKAERNEVRIQRQKDRAEAIRKRNIKNLTDDELRARISRLKLEQEYRELNKNPILEVAKGFVDSYFKMQERKMTKAERAVKLENERRNSMANLIRAKAEVPKAKADIAKARADEKNAPANKYREKKNLLVAKAKTTIRGAFREAISDKIRAKSKAILNNWQYESLGSKAKRGIKNGIQRGRRIGNRIMKSYTTAMINHRYGASGGYGGSLN